MDVSLALAFVAGLLSFVSPCVLALVPVYLAFLGESAGVPVPAGGSPLETAAGRVPVIVPALLFVLGFSLLFILLGTSVGLLGGPLFGTGESRQLVRQVAGIVVIGLGVLNTGAFGPVLERVSLRPPLELLPSAGAARALVLGALVAIGWAPCIGPVLGAILTMGASSQQAAVAALLLTAYSAGLAVPFLAAAVALPRMRPLLGWLRRHHGAVRIASGAFIMLVGVLIFTNAFAQMANLFTFFI